MIVGVVFLTEGVLKLMYPAELGAGRFAHIGLPMPHVLGPLVGCVEIVAGLAVMLNFFAGDAAVLLLAVISTAIITTKIPILLGGPLGPFQPPRLNHYGLLSFVHEARTDLSMLFCLAAILIDRGIRVGRKRKWYQH